MKRFVIDIASSKAERKKQGIPAPYLLLEEGYQAAVSRYPHEVDILPLGEPLDDRDGRRDAGSCAHQHHVLVVDGRLHEAGLRGCDPQR